jgi:hypothetical protein
MTAPVPSSAAAAATSNEPHYGVCHLRLGILVLSKYIQKFLTERQRHTIHKHHPTSTTVFIFFFSVGFIKQPVMEETHFYHQYFNTSRPSAFPDVNDLKHPLFPANIQMENFI